MTNEPRSPFQPTLASRFPRRRVLRVAAGASIVCALAPLLAACSSDSDDVPFHGSAAGVVIVANWPLYLDRAEDRRVIPDAEAFHQRIQAQGELLRMADEVTDPAEAETLRSIAECELVFPTPEQRDALKTFRELTSDEAVPAWNETFGEFYV